MTSVPYLLLMVALIACIIPALPYYVAIPTAAILLAIGLMLDGYLGRCNR